MEVKLERMAIYMTLKCNLRCKLCAAHSPYYENPWHPQMDELCTVVDRVFELISYVEIFQLTGGEPLIRGDLDVLIHHLKKYTHRIGRLVLFTNGSIMPKERIFEALKDYESNLGFVIDNYGACLSCQAELLANRLSMELPTASVELRDYYTVDMHCDGWVNWNVGRPARTDEEMQSVFNKCSIPQKLDMVSCIVDGKSYPCPQTRRCIELGLIEINPEEVIDLFDTSATDDELRERLKNRYKLPVLSACRYCDGQCEDSRRFQPAEQLS